MDDRPAPARASWALVHHTDAEREYAYDRDSPIGRLDKALDEASGARWTVVDMKTRLESDLPVRNDVTGVCGMETADEEQRAGP